MHAFLKQRHNTVLDDASLTLQVNIDFSSEQDMIEKARVGLALQPVCTALFANSPLKEGKPTGEQHPLPLCFVRFGLDPPWPCLPLPRWRQRRPLLSTRWLWL